jgi:hypothetical protein
MNDARIERMLRELHKEPPLQFFEDLFALTDIVAKRIARLRRERKASEAQRPAGSPVLVRG